MEEILALGLVAIITNAAMFGVKLISGLRMTANDPDKKKQLQWILALFAVVGAVFHSGLTGEPLNPDSISALATEVGTAVVLFITSHGTYNWVFRK